MTLADYTAVMVSLNVLLAALAAWQRHQTVAEVRRRRRKRLEKANKR